MREYEAVGLYNKDAEFVGYAVLKTIDEEGREALKLETNVYGEDETDKLAEQIARLNEGADLSGHWPAPNDPELVALLNDPSFFPIEYSMEEVIDDAKLDQMFASGELVPDRDLHEDPVSGNITWLRPEKVPKVWAKVPSDPAAPQARFRKAAEIIALKRMKASR